MSVEDSPNSAAPPGKDPLIGQRFGDCLLQREIGAGAMGRVLLAQHVGLNKPVAVKIMPPDVVGDPRRFLEQAQIAASLEHPHVARVYEAGEADGLCYVAMQLFEGRALDKRIEAKGKLEIPEALEIARKIALALAAAHPLGLVHRDLKPSNVFLPKDGQVKVADFGLAPPEPSRYTAPEGAVDARSDLFSLGAIVRHLVTGRLPEAAEEVEPSLPPGVAGLILKLQAPSPEDRFATAEDVVRALDELEGKAPEPRGDSMLDLFAPAPDPAPSEPAPPPARKADLRPEPFKADGKPLLGKYVLLREIRKEDDDLSVWEAENLVTKARVALRLLTGDDEERARVFHETGADAAQLKHPNILHVLDCQSDTDRKGLITHVMAIEPANVVTLEDVVSARTLPPKRLIHIVEQIARALGYAHQKRRTHLAISPREVQVEPPTRAVIRFHPLGPPRTDRAKAEEDAPFLAPEQVPGANGTADAATDIYRLGALLYWIAAGRTPFEAASAAEVHQLIRTVEPKPPKDVDPAVDLELNRVITKAMRKEKDLRFATAEDLADALRRYLAPKDAAPGSSTRGAVKKIRRNWPSRQTLGAGLLLVVAVAGTLIWRGRRMAEALAEEVGRARLEAFQLQLDGKFEEALSTARRALALVPADEAMLDLSKTCRRKILEVEILGRVGKIEAAGPGGMESAFLEEVAALEPAVRDLRAALGPETTSEEASSVTAAGIGELHLGRFEAAAELLERAAALESRDPAGGLALARAYFARIVLSNAAARLLGTAGDRGARAAEWRTKIVDAMDRPTRPARADAEADVADAYAAIGRGEMARVKALTGGLLRRRPGPAATAEALALRAWASGAEGGADLDDSIKTRPLQSLAYVLRAVRHAGAGRLAAAAADLSVTADLYPGLPVFPLLRGGIRQSMGDLEGARADLARVKSLGGEDWEFQAETERLEDALGK